MFVRARASVRAYYSVAPLLDNPRIDIHCARQYITLYIFTRDILKGHQWYLYILSPLQHGYTEQEMSQPYFSTWSFIYT